MCLPQQTFMARTKIAYALRRFKKHGRLCRDDVEEHMHMAFRIKIQSVLLQIDYNHV